MEKFIKIIFILITLFTNYCHCNLNTLLDVYNTERLANIITNGNASIGLSENCDIQIKNFLQGVIDGKTWALTMSDSSGRYTGSFLWGNNYWLGSSDLCSELRISPDLPEHAPTPVFFVAKLSVLLENRNITPNARQIFLGMCLPASCSVLDVQNLVDLSLNSVVLPTGTSRNITILSVRSPDLDTYRYWTDPTFIVLAVVFCIVVILMVTGSLYDLSLSPKVNLTQNCHHCHLHNANDVALDVFKSAGKKQDVEVLQECNGNHVMDAYSSQSAYQPDNVFEINRLNTSTQSGVISSPDPSLQVNSTSSALETTKSVLLCFSIPRNAKTIFDNSVGDDTLSTLHGLRFLSMVWVILGHSCIVTFKYADNSSFRGVVEKEFFFQTISNAAFSVDTFFFISGLLFSFLYFRTASKVDLNVITRATGVTSKFLQVVGLLAYRFGRLTAPYMFVLGVVQVSMKWFNHKSVFEPPTLDHENCPKYWWRNALYINTLYPVKDMCMLWSWYLADDTQFYVLGAILMIIAVSHFRTAASMFVMFLVSSWCTTAYIAYSNNHQPSLDDPLALFDKIYDKPWTRLGPYLVGMGTGWLLYNINCKLVLNKGGIALGWALCSATLLSLLYGLYDARLDAVSSAAYSSLSHTAWALGTAWVVVACSTGHGGFVGKILSAPALYPLSRVTYCAYLVHPMVIRTMVMYVDAPLHLARSTVTLLFLGHTVVSYLLAFAVSLAFEAPVVALLRLVSPNKKQQVKSR